MHLSPERALLQPVQQFGALSRRGCDHATVVVPASINVFALVAGFVASPRPCCVT